MKETRTAIVYLPNGKERCFTTSQKVNKTDSSYQLVDKIEGEPDSLSIVFRDGNSMEGYSYVNIPYTLQISKPK